MPTAPGVAAKSGFYGNRALQQGTSVHLSCDQSLGIASAAREPTNKTSIEFYKLT